MGGDLAKAIIVGKMCKFVKLCGVIRGDMASPKGASQDDDVEDVDCGFVDGTFGHVAYSEGYGQSHQQENNLVGGSWQQYVSEYGGDSDVAYHECES